MNIDTLSDQRFHAMLFDMDGTITSSRVAAERVWGRWARKHGLDVQQFLPTIHGVRTVDTIRRLQLPGVDPAGEAAKITAAEIEEVDGVEEISGAGELLHALPGHRWAVVTSAPRDLAHARIRAAGLPLPQTLISAEDVSIGKPDPQGYLLAARKLGVDISDCLIFEDAEAGIQAALAAGGQLVVVAATSSGESSAYTTITDYSGLSQKLLNKLA